MENQCGKCFRHFKTQESLKNHEAFHLRQQKGHGNGLQSLKRKADESAIAEPNGGSTESKRLVVDTQNHPKDQSVIKSKAPEAEMPMDTTNASTRKPLPFALSANRLQVFLSPLSLWLCPMCIEASSKKDAWVFNNSGRTYATLSMCKQCVECNAGMQDVANKHWNQYFQLRQAEIKRKEAS